MANFGIPTLSSMEDEPHYGDTYNNTGTSSHYQVFDNFAVLILMLCICIIGLGGNGTVIYHLGFQIKRSPFTTYILNLAIADFGFLLLESLTYIAILTHNGRHPLALISFIASIYMYGASQLLLTAISIDRCVSVLFPIWHRCHQPPHLSTTVCALIWVLTCLSLVSTAILVHSDIYWILLNLSFFVGAILCFPIVTLSTMILLCKVSCKLRQHHRGKLLTIVLLTFLFFIIFAFPLTAIVTINYFTSFQYSSLLEYGFLCAYLNSCVNPVIYYLVGRKKRSPQRQSLKVIFQRAFKEEEEHREEQGTTAQRQL